MVKDTLTTRRRQRLAANPAMVPCSVQIQAAATEQQQDEHRGQPLPHPDSLRIVELTLVLGLLPVMLDLQPLLCALPYALA